MLEAVLTIANVVFISTREAPKSSSTVPGVLDVIGDISGAWRLGNWRGKIDAILISRIKNLEFLSLIREYFPKEPIIYDAECLVSLRNQRALELFSVSEVIRAKLMRLEQEIALIRLADIVTTTGQLEQHVLASNGIHEPIIVSYFVDNSKVGGPFTGRNGAVMLGRFNGLLGGLPHFPPPNEDAVAYILETLLDELVLRRGVSIDIAGLGSEGLSVQHKQVRLLGMVQDLNDLFARYLCFIAPTRYSSGISLKAIEAWARGLPVILSRQLHSQLDLCEKFPSCDTADSYAEAIDRIALKESDWRSARNAGLKIVASRFSRLEFNRAMKRALSKAGVR